MRAVVFGDFECAFSYLASHRVDRLAEHGIPVTWIAVHRCVGSARGDLRFPPDQAFEAAVVQSWLEPDESAPIHAPTVPTDTRGAVAALAAAHDADAARLRQALFDAYWVEGSDIGDPRVVEKLAGRRVPRFSLRARRWRRNWLGLGCPDLPAAILEDGTLVRGVAAVDELTIARRKPMESVEHLHDVRDPTHRGVRHRR
ncbi:MAG: DsbA family protein [Actinobacteria bacterium]|nr:DsbA family protein [Actinomycetota bacterium]